MTSRASGRAWHIKVNEVAFSISVSVLEAYNIREEGRFQNGCGIFHEASLRLRETGDGRDGDGEACDVHNKMDG